MVLLLRAVQLKGFFGRLQWRLSAQFIVGLAPIHLDGLFFKEMQVELADFPYAVLLGALFIHIFLSGRVKGIGRQLGANTMRGVSVLAVYIVADQHLGFILAHQLHHIILYLFLAPERIGFAFCAQRLIEEMPDDRVMAHAHRPKAVEHFALPHIVGAGKIAYHHALAAHHLVIRDRAAHKQQFIVGVRYQHH